MVRVGVMSKLWLGQALIKHAIAHTQRIGQMRRNAAEWPNAPDTDMEEWQLTINNLHCCHLAVSSVPASSILNK